MLTTTTGAVQLWQQNKEHWTRGEALANIAVAEFVELPEMKVIQAHANEDEFCEQGCEAGVGREATFCPLGVFFVRDIL